MSGTKQKNCKWCGSNGHSSEACPTRNLVKFLLLDEPFTGKLPDLVVVSNEEHLISTIEEAHAIQHIKSLKGTAK